MTAKTPPKAPLGLVDHLGRPVRSENLKVEVSGASLTGVRSILSGHPEIGLDPVRLAAILRTAEQGDATAYLELAEAMEEKDLHYLSVLGTRKRAVAQLPITVEAADETPEAEADAQLVRDWLKRDTLEDELLDILDAVGKGFSVSEIVWEMSEGQWWPRRLIWRDPRWFQFDRVDGSTIRLKDGSPDGADLEPFKYVVHTMKAKSGLTLRGGLARAAAWIYLFKNFSIKDWVAFAEVYGLPFRLGRYDPSATAEDRRALLTALAMIGSDAAGIIPKTTDIEFVDGKMAASDGALFEKLATYFDQQMSKAVLGQTATTDAVASGLGGGLGNVHNDVRGDIERADAKVLGATLSQQVAQPLVMLNRGPRKAYPRIVIGREEALDVKATTESLDTLVGLGLKVTQSFARKLIRAPEPKEGEACLTPRQTEPVAIPAERPPEVLPKPASQPPSKSLPAQAEPKTPGRAQKGLLGPLKTALERVTTHALADGAPDGDAIDDFVELELAGWKGLVAPAIDPLKAMLTEASSLEDARDRLIGVFEQMDGDALADLLARAGFNARLAGEAGQLLGGADL